MTSNKPKILYIGSVQMSSEFLSVLLNDSRFVISGIVTKEKSTYNADFFCLSDVPETDGIPTFYFKDNIDQMSEWITTKNPDIMFCFGWSHILPIPVLKFPKFGTIGFHPASLPMNRGRHPLIWPLVLGLKETSSTFFMMEGGVDDGDIVDQKSLSISEDEDASSLYEKVTKIGKSQISDILNQLAEGKLSRLPQDHSKATSWRKRSRKDGEIDWRMSAITIDRLVKALTRPYVGASFNYNEKEIKIWKSRVVKENIPQNREPGYVLESQGNKIVVKCGEDALELVEYSGLSDLPVAGDYL